jgi:hypothetical protein
MNRTLPARPECALAGALLLLLMAVPRGLVAQQADLAPFTFAGQVLNGATDAPIAGAVVVIEELGISVVSDEDGFFAIVDMTPGRFTFTTTHEDFHANSEPSVVAAGAVLFVRLLPLAVPAGARTAASRLLSLERGARVRVRLVGTSPIGGGLVGVLRDVRPDTLLLGYPPTRPGSVMPLPLSEIDRLEVSVSRRSRAPLGAAVGALLGGLTVFGYNAIRRSQCVQHCPEHNVSLLIGVGIGGLIGGVGLSFVSADRWVELPVGNAQGRQEGQRR